MRLEDNIPTACLCKNIPILYLRGNLSILWRWKDIPFPLQRENISFALSKKTRCCIVSVTCTFLRRGREKGFPSFCEAAGGVFLCCVMEPEKAFLHFVKQPEASSSAA